MPDMTRMLIAGAELRAERLIAALRVAVALVLGASFALAVLAPGGPEDAAITRQILFAGVTLVLYLGLGILAWRLSRPEGGWGGGGWRPWMAWVFATADVAVVVLSVEASLVNTGLAPGWTAALPAIWLAPLVLAFGALRYNPWLQGYVGLLLLLGLLLPSLVGGATAPPVLPVERLQYLFGPPPNIMRLVMLALAVAVLATAAWRARRLLHRAVAEARRSINLTRFLPPEIAAALDGAGTIPGRRQTASILFVDICGFTALAETMDPVALGRLVSEFRSLVGRTAAGHGGMVDKYIGDGALLVFGAPTPAPDDAARALACGRALAAGVAGWSAAREADEEAPVQVGIGIHTGAVFCGTMGDENRMEFTVLGDTVNVAARLEKETRRSAFALLTSADTLTAAGLDPAQLESKGWVRLPAHPLPGRDAPITLYGALPRGPEGSAGPAPTADAPDHREFQDPR